MKKTLLITGLLFCALSIFAQKGSYLPGDFHQHTLYTDGSSTFAEVMKKNSDYGLAWWANSEHGGARNRDGMGDNWDNPEFYPVNPVMGDVKFSGDYQLMWRWQGIRYYVFPDILKTRTLLPNKTIISGLEWNVPGHEHCSTAIYQYDNTATAISEFEYRFDRSDEDLSLEGKEGLLESFGTLSKKNETKEDAIEAIRFMQTGFEQKLWNAWVVPAHVERAKSYHIEDFRNWNNAGPDVAFGFEGAPGHQTSGDRGFSRNALGGGTYGGVGYFTAKVGGLWDALLGEGRAWWNFASSDYHKHWSDGGSDFWPGEYQKNYAFIDQSNPDKQNAVFNALRSGNSYYVEGDLIDELHFVAYGSCKNKAMMGETLKVKRGEYVHIMITVNDPQGTNNCPINMTNPALEGVGIIQALNKPELDHIDLISGPVKGYVSPESDQYTKDENPGTKITETFEVQTRRSHFFKKYQKKSVFRYSFRAKEDQYFRLRGTNLPANVPMETDQQGNPLADSEASDGYYDSLDEEFLAEKLFPGVNINTNSKLAEVVEAYADLWFYSNPIFIDVE